MLSSAGAPGDGEPLAGALQRGKGDAQAVLTALLAFLLALLAFLLVQSNQGSIIFVPRWSQAARRVMVSYS